MSEAVEMTWFVNAHRIWYGTHGAALSNGTLLTNFTNLPISRDVNLDANQNCVTLSGKKILFVDCSLRQRASFACILEPRIKSNFE